MAMKLGKYNKKRDFTKTREPEGKPAAAEEAFRFVVQKHDASRLHFDFRLEQDGVLWSWAVPKGPSYNPKDRRLAVHVEDHPMEYRNFEGTIPKGEYGGGTVMLFDEGVWIPDSDPVKGLEEGSLKFSLEGERLKGRWTLVRMKPKEGEDDKNWLLIKEKDEFVQDSNGISDITTSVRSGRTMEDISKEEPTSLESVDESTKGSVEKPEKEKKSPGKKAQSDTANPKKDASKNSKPGTDNTKAEVSLSALPDLSGELPFKKSKPMLATLVKKALSGKEWIHELKLDGYRILAFLERGKARLLTRNGKDWSDKVPELIETLEEWNPGNLVLDGELVVMDENGRSDFQALQSYFKKPENKNVDYVIFDLLAAGDEDLRPKTLLERKALLEQLLRDSPAGLHFSSHTEGSAIFDKVCEADMEGIISKKKDSSYHPTRSKDWVKTKCESRQEFVVGGYTTSDKSSTGLSSLLLGAYEGENLNYKGRSGTGFSELEAVDLMKQFKNLLRETSPFTEQLKPRADEIITYLDPKLVAEIKFAEITDDGLLRQASFKGLRVDKSASEVISEIPEEIIPENAPDETSDETNEDITQNTVEKNTLRKAEPKDKKVSYGEVALSSPDKLVFPEDGITKKDIADYYWDMRDAILPYLVDRPMTLLRCTDSIDDCFYQKHMNHTIPGMDTKNVPDNDGKDAEAMILRDETSLIGAVQMGTLEFHSWGSKLNKLEQPDWIVFDLDPDVGMTVETIRKGVRDLKSILDEMDLVSFLKRIFQNIECLNPLRYLGLRHFLCFRCMARTSPPEV